MEVVNFFETFENEFSKTHCYQWKM